MRTRPSLPSRAGVLVAACLAAFSTASFAGEAEVITVKGKGEARATARDDWRAAVVKQKLKGGAFVRTGDASQMALLMDDQTQLRLNQNSMLQIKESSAGAPARLDLRAGRAWMQSKQAANVVVDTPNATAAIRGTDWELEVDPSGKTLLAVFSGTVEFSNPQGSVSVGKDEGAVAEAGKAPVKVVLTRPRDRIQWVNALAVDPRHHAEAAKASPVVKSALDLIGKGEMAQARAQLQAERGKGSRDKGVYALLADIALVAGEFQQAIAITREALAFAPRDPELLAQLAREQLLADDVEGAKKTVAQPREAETAGILVAAGEVARREGLAPPALEAFEKATRAAPADDRGWYALGRAQGEREDVAPARRNLAKAIELNATGAGYHGELGTVETFANRFGNAEAAFDAALKGNPADYVALTGLGLLRLKQGRPDAALDAFLRAGVLEPGYARAKTYTAVAYYQLGRHADAIETFRQAAALDDKDPLPYLFLTQIYTDLFRAGDAVEASREALKRLPYLKSLNQVANDQQGTSNFGYSLAFFGLESWALEIAQQSYNPHTAASHLFLADRYSGLYNKNSELFQGFLTDPTAFGGSNRFSTLTPRPGSYGTLGLGYTDSTEYTLSNPYVRLNGVADWAGRSAWYVDVESGVGTVLVPTTAPDGLVVNVKGDRRAELYAVGLGIEPTASLGLFGFATSVRDNVVLRDYGGTVGSQDKERIDLGARYRFSPTSMSWLKFGRTNEDTLFDNYFAFSADFSSGFASNSRFRGRPSDLAARHTMDLTPADHVAIGIEAARDSRFGALQQAGVASLPSGFVVVSITYEQTAELESRQAYGSYVRDLAPHLMLQGDLFWQRFDQGIEQSQVTLVQIGGESYPSYQYAKGESRKSEWNPRVGISYTPPGFGVRAAWQRWTQPVSTNTLSPVATAGIPADDRLVAAGGKAERTALRFNGELGAATQFTAYYDNEKVRNLGQLGVRIPVPEIQFVDLLRNRQVINAATQDILEDTPDFDEGRAEILSLTANHMLSREFSLTASYSRTRNRATIYVRDDAGNLVAANSDARIPYLPENVGVVGFTWASPWRIYLSGQAVYRSERYTDRDNTPAGLLRADTTGTVLGFWESADKRVILGAGAGNLGSKARKEVYVVDARFRF